MRFQFLETCALPRERRVQKHALRINVKVAAAFAAQESESPSQRGCGRLTNGISLSHGASQMKRARASEGASFAQTGLTVNGNFRHAS
jgi:hypothetical protein